MTKSREDFEAWFNKQPMSIIFKTGKLDGSGYGCQFDKFESGDQKGEYRNLSVQMCWSCWKNFDPEFKVLASLNDRQIIESSVLYSVDGTKLIAAYPWLKTYPLRMIVVDKRIGDPDYWATDTHFDGKQVLFWDDPTK